jgi:hypothetical protein
MRGRGGICGILGWGSLIFGLKTFGLKVWTGKLRISVGKLQIFDWKPWNSDGKASNSN